MIPDNPTNNNPFIFRILDSLGIAHQVAPVNHQHDMLVGQTVRLIINGNEIELETSDLPNILRALSDPDSTPTHDSDKLITSAAVYAALAGKQATLTFDNDPTSGSNNPVKSGGIFTALAAKLQKLTTFTTGNFPKIKSDGTLEDSGKKASDFADAGTTAASLAARVDKVDDATENNFAVFDKHGGIKDSGTRASSFLRVIPIDQYPTSGSTNLVYSGGVAAALAEIEYSDSGSPIDLDILFGDKSIIKKKVIGINNIQPQDISIHSRLYSESGAFVEFANNIGDIPAEGTVIVTVYWMSSSYFVTLNGIFE